MWMKRNRKMSVLSHECFWPNQSILRVAKVIKKLRTKSHDLHKVKTWDHRGTPPAAITVAELTLIESSFEGAAEQGCHENPKQ